MLTFTGLADVFYPQTLNCLKLAVVQSFKFIGELFKNNKSLVSRGTKQRKICEGSSNIIYI